MCIKPNRAGWGVKISQSELLLSLEQSSPVREYSKCNEKLHGTTYYKFHNTVDSIFILHYFYQIIYLTQIYYFASL